jgi:uncharacterized membrane protein YbhN (UPF0104 family)
MTAMKQQPSDDERRAAASLLAARQWLGRARPIGALIGVALLAAAAFVVVREWESLATAMEATRAASFGVVAAMAATMLASVLLTGAIFWLLTRRFGPVGFVDMQALMAATALANYLPLRPGLVGRVVYHRQRHGIRPVDSLRTIVEAMALSALVLVLLVPSMLAVHAGGLPSILGVALPLAVGVLVLAARERFRGLAAAFLLRFGETLLTALRYDLAFRLTGSAIPWHASVAVACVSMIATMVPFVSNGIGLREWAVGLLAPLLVDTTLERGLAAELINRVIEVGVIAPCGLIGFGWLWRDARDPRPNGS